MSDETKTIAGQILAEMKKAKREGAKAKAKALIVDLQKSDEVSKGIFQKLQETLAEVGEDVSLADLLSE